MGLLILFRQAKHHDILIGKSGDGFIIGQRIEGASGFPISLISHLSLESTLALEAVLSALSL